MISQNTRRWSGPKAAATSAKTTKRIYAGQATHNQLWGVV